MVGGVVEVVGGTVVVGGVVEVVDGVVVVGSVVEAVDGIIVVVAGNVEVAAGALDAGLEVTGDGVGVVFVQADSMRVTIITIVKVNQSILFLLISILPFKTTLT